MLHFLINGLTFGYHNGAIFAATDFDDGDKEHSIGLYDLDGKCLEIGESAKAESRQKTRQAIQNYNVMVLVGLAKIEKLLEEIDDFVFWHKNAGHANQERLEFLLDLCTGQGDEAMRVVDILNNRFIAKNDPEFCRYAGKKLTELAGQLRRDSLLGSQAMQDIENWIARRVVEAEQAE